MPPLLQTFSDSDSPQRRKSAKLGEILNLSEQKSGFCYCKPALNEVLILSRERLQSDGLGSPFDRVLPTRLVALYLRPMCIIQIFNTYIIQSQPIYKIFSLICSSSISM